MVLNLKFVVLNGLFVRRYILIAYKNSSKPKEYIVNSSLKPTGTLVTFLYFTPNPLPLQMTSYLPSSAKNFKEVNARPCILVFPRRILTSFLL